MCDLGMKSSLISVLNLDGTFITVLPLHDFYILLYTFPIKFSFVVRLLLSSFFRKKKESFF